MDPVERAEAIAAAERAGIDLSLVDANLRLSVVERWQRHDAALDLILKLQAAREHYDAKLQPAAQKTG